MAWEDTLVEAHAEMARVSGEQWRAARGTNAYFDFTPLGTRTAAGQIPQVRYSFVSAAMGPRSLSDMHGLHEVASQPWRQRIRVRVVGKTVEETMVEAMAVQSMLHFCGVSSEFTDVSWENTTAADFNVERGYYAANFDFVMNVVLTQGWSWRDSVVIEDHAEDTYEIVEDIPDRQILSGSAPPL